MTYPPYGTLTAANEDALIQAVLTVQPEWLRPGRRQVPLRDALRFTVWYLSTGKSPRDLELAAAEYGVATWVLQAKVRKLAPILIQIACSVTAAASMPETASGVRAAIGV